MVVISEGTLWKNTTGSETTAEVTECRQIEKVVVVWLREAKQSAEYDYEIFRRFWKPLEIFE